jgi:hypothetical protein
MMKLGKQKAEITKSKAEILNADTLKLISTFCFQDFDFLLTSFVRGQWSAL